MMIKRVIEEIEKNDYPERIMQILRSYRGLDDDDESQDEEIKELSHNEAFDQVMAYYNYGHALSIKGFIKDIYGVDLK